MNLVHRQSGVGAAFKALLKAGRKPLLASAGALMAAALVARDLADMSIEELLNESVTSVSKREQKRGDVAAAIHVLSNDDLRRSGAQTLPDVLRTVPGINVGGLNAGLWAVSARGFNSPFANKLLVLVDGRAVYSPLFAGVYWDLQQRMFEDVDRVEVIRGPGATVWGANAVNGVISVVSRSAKDTHGGLIYGGGGDVVESLSGFRYGAGIGGDTHFRIFASRHETGDSPLANGQPAGDSTIAQHGGFRLDHYSSDGVHATWQADTSRSDFDGGLSDAYNVNTIGRWTRELSPESTMEAQVYFDRVHRDEYLRTRNTIDTVDFELQQTIGFGARHDLIWGIGYRRIANLIEDVATFSEVREGDFSVQLFSAFVQDEIEIVPEKLTFTAGTKFEHNDMTGFEVQPSVRAVFKPAENQTLWASISRAVRTPNELEGRDVFGLTYGAPFSTPSGLYLPQLVGNPDVDSEVLWAYEAGYRFQPDRRVNVEFAAFYNDYRDVIGISEVARFVPGTPIGYAEMSWDNVLRAETYGVEASVTASPTTKWRLTGSYSELHTSMRSAVKTPANTIDWSAPKHQVTLRSSHDFGARTNLDVQFRYVAAVPLAAAYLTADVRLAYRPTDRIEVSLIGQNLLDPQHPEEAPDPSGAVTAEVPRRLFGKFTWRF